MYIYKRLNSNDITITPFQAFKSWNVNESTAPSSSINVYRGTYTYLPADLYDSSSAYVKTLPTTSNGQYEYLVHDSLNHLFYSR